MIISGSSVPGPRAPGPMDQWPTKVAGAVEDLAGVIRSKAVRPLETVARLIVLGIIAAIVGLVTVILTAVGTIRVLNVYLFAGQEWASYLIVGGIFLVVAMLCSSRKRAGGTSRE